MAKLHLKHVRCSFPDIFKPRSYNGGDARYSIQLLIPKDHEQVDEIKKMALEAAKDKWGSKIKGDEFPKSLRNPLRDGDEERDTDELPHYENHFFMSCNSKHKPVVVGNRKGPDGKFPVLEEDDIQGGDYVNVILSDAYAYDHNGNKGVSFGLDKVQFVAKGERLGGGGRTSAEEDFDEEPGEDDII